MKESHFKEKQITARRIISIIRYWFRIFRFPPPRNFHEQLWELFWENAAQLFPSLGSELRKASRSIFAARVPKRQNFPDRTPPK